MSQTGGVGTPSFMAPEMFSEAKHALEVSAHGKPGVKKPKEKKKYSSKVDVYSFGITLAGTLNGELPYAGHREDELNPRNFYTLVEKGMRPKVKNADDVPSDLITLMQQCWDFYPENRPSFDDIVDRLQVILKSLRRPARRPY